MTVIVEYGDYREQFEQTSNSSFEKSMFYELWTPFSVYSEALVFIVVFYSSVYLSLGMQFNKGGTRGVQGGPNIIQDQFQGFYFNAQLYKVWHEYMSIKHLSCIYVHREKSQSYFWKCLVLPFVCLSRKILKRTSWYKRSS